MERNYCDKKRRKAIESYRIQLPKSKRRKKKDEKKKDNGKNRNGKKKKRKGRKPIEINRSEEEKKDGRANLEYLKTRCLHGIYYTGCKYFSSLLYL